MDKRQSDQRESRYHEIRKGYAREDFAHFPEMFGLLTLAMEDAGFDDVLGGLYMMLELGNARSGQFFTPYPVSRMMASMIVGDGADARERGFLDMAEPACGAGGIVIAVADALHAVGVNYQRHLHATCIDIDLRCVHMTYLQASLLHIPAIVVHGNSICGEVWGHWYARPTCWAAGAAGSRHAARPEPSRLAKQGRRRRRPCHPQPCCRRRRALRCAGRCACSEPVARAGAMRDNPEHAHDAGRDAVRGHLHRRERTHR